MYRQSSSLLCGQGRQRTPPTRVDVASEERGLTGLFLPQSSRWTLSSIFRLRKMPVQGELHRTPQAPQFLLDPVKGLDLCVAAHDLTQTTPVCCSAGLLYRDNSYRSYGDRLPGWTGQLCCQPWRSTSPSERASLAGCAQRQGQRHGNDAPRHGRTPVWDWWAAKNFGEVTSQANRRKWRWWKVGRSLHFYPLSPSLLTHFLPDSWWRCDSCSPAWHSSCQSSPLPLARSDQLQCRWAQHLHGHMGSSGSSLAFLPPPLRGCYGETLRNQHFKLCSIRIKAMS